MCLKQHQQRRVRRQQGQHLLQARALPPRRPRPHREALHLSRSRQRHSSSRPHSSSTFSAWMQYVPLFPSIHLGRCPCGPSHYHH